MQTIAPSIPFPVFNPLYPQGIGVRTALCLRPVFYHIVIASLQELRSSQVERIYLMGNARNFSIQNHKLWEPQCPTK